MGDNNQAKTQRNWEMAEMWLSDPGHLNYSHNKLAVRYGISPARIGFIIRRTLERRAKAALLEKEARDGS